MKIELTQELNEIQKQAVEYCNGMQLVIAGAGSGKTRVLTYKIAYLISIGFKPSNILALTFTNKAANEMKQRIGMLVGYDTANRIFAGTFHSIFSRILRTESEKIGYKSNFSIYDESDSRSLIAAIIKEMGIEDTTYKPATIQSDISMAKNFLITADQYISSTDFSNRDKNRNRPKTGQIYKKYTDRCRKANAMDFDDLLIMTYKLFHEHDDVLNKYKEIFKCILVDEYQDTNYAQQRIIDLLSDENKHVCMVGDDAQSIYAFRGANIDYMLNFQNSNTLKIFKLEQNYRSTQCIVKAANSLIKHNMKQIVKDVYSKNEIGEKLTLKRAFSDKEEASIVCNEIKRLKNAVPCSYADFCILYRTNSLSRSIEEEMRRQNLPYKVYGGLSFYQRKEIKDIIAYFRITANPNDEEAMKRIINYPMRGIGAVTLQKLLKLASTLNLSIWQMIECESIELAGLSKATVAKIGKFRDMIKAFIEKSQKLNAYDMGKIIINESGIAADVFSGTNPEDLSRQQNVGEFMTALKDYVEEKLEQGDENTSISSFIQEVALISDSDNNDDTKQRISLMTVHAAKGLEFPTVFIIGLEENIFPSQRSLASVKEIEEERRLMYVAITRAKRRCYLLFAKSRYLYGRIEFGTPSRFIKEINPTLISYKQESIHSNTTFYKDKTSRIIQQSYIPSQSVSHTRKINLEIDYKKQNENSNSQNSVVSNLHIGSIIQHQRFGIGTVEKLEGNGENTKATVMFKNLGVKQLLLKFARYKVIKTLNDV